MTLTQSIVRDMLIYDPASGALMRRKNSPNGPAHKPLGSATKSGHLYFSLCGKKYLVHRVVWLYMTGSLPVTIDHINGDPSDNRWVNLRGCTLAQNRKNNKVSRNNKSGHPGVIWVGSRQRWMSYIRCEYRHIFLGYFSKIEAAIAARVAAEVRYFGAFSRNHADLIAAGA